MALAGTEVGYMMIPALALKSPHCKNSVPKGNVNLPKARLAVESIFWGRDKVMFAPKTFPEPVTVI